MLSNEPALARATPPGERGNDAPNNVLFTRLKAGFTLGGGRMVIRDATMWGQSVGGTLEGTLDFSRDQANLTGTFVPAYGLNNMINQVPLVGPIIGGGQHEGLFAVNFRISGRISQPALTINPLSAVAPGFLRKFFGVFTPDETGEPPARPPARRGPYRASCGSRKRVAALAARGDAPSAKEDPMTFQAFRISGLDPAPFEALYGLPDDELIRRGVIRRRVEDASGYPDRIEMREARPGEPSCC